MKRGDLVVEIPRDALRARYALGVLLRLVGREWRDAEPGERPDLVYASGRAGLCTIPAGPAESWDAPSPIVTRVGSLPVLHLPGAPPGEGAAPGFDVLYATYACLTAPWERTDPADEVGCPIAAEGFLARHGLLVEPLVHRYARRLGDAIGVTQPPRAQPLLVLTHDVDNNFGHLFRVRERWELLRRDVRAREPRALRRAAGLLRQLPRRGRDPNDRFDEWERLHGMLGSRPAYFVASRGLFHPGAARQDVPYDLRHPEVRRTLREAVDDGAEVGVHLSIGAHESEDRIRREREALEEAVGVPVRSARHHWWALGPEPERTLRLHAAAGLEVDCSFGWNDRVGFRRGIAVPFRPFDSATGRASELWALPTTAMDAAVVAGRSPEAAADVLGSLVRTVAEVDGVLVLDWHAHALNPASLPGAGVALRRFLEGAGAGATLATPLEAVRSRLP